MILCFFHVAELDIEISRLETGLIFYENSNLKSEPFWVEIAVWSQKSHISTIFKFQFWVKIAVWSQKSHINKNHYVDMLDLFDPQVLWKRVYSLCGAYHSTLQIKNIKLHIVTDIKVTINSLSVFGFRYLAGGRVIFTTKEKQTVVFGI